MSNGTGNVNNIDEHEDYDRVTTAIGRVLVPVVLCMILAVWLVNSLGNGCPSPDAGRGTKPTALPAFREDVTKLKPNQTERGTMVPFGRMAAIIFTAVFVVLIVVFTYFLVWLFKKGYNRFIFGWLFCAVLLIFGYVGGVYIFEFCRSRCITLDWITLCFVTWNLSVGAVVSIFGSVPRLVNQAYLIVMSALMAYVFRQLPEWCVWVILAVLVLWDLFAVLSPWGPLRKLVEHARERGEQLPALVYDTNPADVGRDPEALPQLQLGRGRDKKAAQRKQPASTSGTATATASATPPPDDGDQPGRRRRMKLRKRRKDDADAPDTVEPQETVDGQRADEVTTAPMVDAVSPAPAPAITSGTTPQTMTNTANDTAGQKTEIGNGSKPRGVGTLGTYLKLGLGDFVFYSILVAVSSRNGAMTTVTSFVGILAGLCMTLFLVLVYRKALPALPISIVFGMVFYFLTKYTMVPFVTSMFVANAYH